VLPRPVITFLVILVSLAWTANLVVGYFKLAETEPSVNAIFAIIVGALFAMGKKKPDRSDQ
jgi:hypothetical protein